jgi:hypothetical protein
MVVAWFFMGLAGFGVTAGSSEIERGTPATFVTENDPESQSKIAPY